MLVGNLANPMQWKSFTQSSLLEQSFRWISANADSAQPGIHELGKPGWFVNVHGATTQSREQCTWENHPETVDLQYMIEGVEGIDVTDVGGLGDPTSFKAESDTQKFGAYDNPSTHVILQPGRFAVFLPGEAHRPKIAVKGPSALRKLVIKIPAKLF